MLLLHSVLPESTVLQCAGPFSELLWEGKSLVVDSLGEGLVLGGEEDVQRDGAAFGLSVDGVDEPKRGLCPALASVLGQVDERISQRVVITDDVVVVHAHDDGIGLLGLVYEEAEGLLRLPHGIERGHLATAGELGLPQTEHDIGVTGASQVRCHEVLRLLQREHQDVGVRWDLVFDEFVAQTFVVALAATARGARPARAHVTCVGVPGEGFDAHRKPSVTRGAPSLLFGPTSLALDRPRRTEKKSKALQNEKERNHFRISEFSRGSGGCSSNI
eukprot:scaffold699_cov231-Pinguiococcus_pyrenoidosus.AAC.16